MSYLRNADNKPITHHPSVTQISSKPHTISIWVGAVL